MKGQYKKGIPGGPTGLMGPPLLLSLPLNQTTPLLLLSFSFPALILTPPVVLAIPPPNPSLHSLLTLPLLFVKNCIQNLYTSYILYLVFFFSESQ